jgi:hypothetical protein
MKKYFYLLAIWAVNFVACSDESANKGDSVIVNSSMEVERLVMNISKSFTSYTRGNIGEFVYPDYYGGMYTNDSGYPVVLIKGNISSITTIIHILYQAYNSKIIYLIFFGNICRNIGEALLY